MSCSHAIDAVRRLCTTLEAAWLNQDSLKEDALFKALETAKLRELLGARGQGNIGIAQVNATPGDLAGNARVIRRYMAMSEALRLDLLIFPELALMGYPPRDVIGRHP